MALRASPLVRWLMPLSMVAGIGLFIVSHTYPVDNERMDFSASVEGGSDVPLYQIKVYTFALKNTIKMMCVVIVVTFCASTTISDSAHPLTHSQVGERRVAARDSRRVVLRDLGLLEDDLDARALVSSRSRRAVLEGSLLSRRRWQVVLPRHVCGRPLPNWVTRPPREASRVPRRKHWVGNAARGVYLLHCRDLGPPLDPRDG